MAGTRKCPMRAWKVGLGLLVAAMLAFGMLVPLGLPRRCPVNRAAFERIEEGMSVAEVEKILGGPEGDYRVEPTPAFECHFSSGPIMMDRRRWQGDEGDVEVCFNRSGCVS